MARRRRTRGEPAKGAESSAWLHCRVPEADLQRLRAEARAKGFASVSAYVRDALRTYWLLEEEMASSVGRAGDEKSGRIIHRLLAETEERLAAASVASLRTVHRRLDRVHARLTELEVMVAQAYRGFLSHTPAVPDEHRDAFARSGAERYRRWQQSVERLVERGGGALPAASVDDANDRLDGAPREDVEEVGGNDASEHPKSTVGRMNNRDSPRSTQK